MTDPSTPSKVFPNVNGRSLLFARAPSSVLAWLVAARAPFGIDHRTRSGNVQNPRRCRRLSAEKARNGEPRGSDGHRPLAAPSAPRGRMAHWVRVRAERARVLEQRLHRRMDGPEEHREGRREDEGPR